MPGRLVWRKPAGPRRLGDRRSQDRAEENQDAIAGHDPLRRPHRAAGLGRCVGRSQARTEECDTHRPAARSYRYGGERPRPRAVLDAADRLARRAQDREPPVMRPAWRIPATWIAILSVSFGVHTYVAMLDAARHGHPVPLWQVAVLEGSSHLMIGALLPALYWLARRWPVPGVPRNLLI